MFYILYPVVTYLLTLVYNGDSDDAGKDEPYKNKEGTHNRCSSKCGIVV
jgi:hypothetical protein